MAAKTHFEISTRIIRRAFSLAEILVAIAIVAIVSAVIIPGVSGHVARSDSARIGSDLAVIQAAVQAFVSDVHRYPLTLSELTTKIVAGDKDLDNVNIPSQLIPRWKGPYLAKDAIIPQLHTVTISSTFSKFTAANSVSYIAVTLTAVTSKDFDNLESMFDATTASSTSTGVIQYNAATKTVTYLALPIL